MRRKRRVGKARGEVLDLRDDWKKLRGGHRRAIRPERAGGRVSRNRPEKKWTKVADPLIVLASAEDARREHCFSSSKKGGYLGGKVELRTHMKRDLKNQSIHLLSQAFCFREVRGVKAGHCMIFAQDERVWGKG